jgi:hypothetical protein|eukprot:COSAG01_NODE_3007_length_6730_cov_10.756899_2_plen_350_part_00
MLSTSLLVGLAAAAGAAVLDNTRLPLDQHGNKLITGEAGVLHHNGKFYLYTNDWNVGNSCPGVDCCASSSGCGGCCFNAPSKPPQPMRPDCTDPKNGSNPYGYFHQFVVYSTIDFKTWEYLGVAMPLSARKPGEMMRPHVLFNQKTQLFVMWYEDRPEVGYSVATSPTPGGPFKTVKTDVKMPGKGRIADMDLFMDDDGTAYQVRTSFTVVQLTDDYLGPAKLSSEIRPPHSSEAPVMFRRGDWYYVLVGNDCCYCVGGSNAMVMMAKTPSGPWSYAGDVGSVPGHKFDIHCPHNFVTNAQAQKVFSVPPSASSAGPASAIENSFVWLGMQVGSTPPPASCFLRRCAAD